MPAERTVRQLRVRAPDAALARRARLLLEDALRTASLPGEGAALVLVRRLTLPPFRGSATPASLALALEARCSALRVLAVTAQTDEDELAAAPAVRFRDALQAHWELTARVLRGIDVRAWCWPLAVSGFRAGMDPGGALRATALSLLERPEASAALPLWVDDVVTKGAAARLLTALTAGDAEWLLRALPAGVAPRSRTLSSLPAPAPSPLPSDEADAPSLDPALMRWRDAMAWAEACLGASDSRCRWLAALAQWCRPRLHRLDGRLPGDGPIAGDRADVARTFVQKVAADRRLDDGAVVAGRVGGEDPEWGSIPRAADEVADSAGSRAASRQRTDGHGAACDDSRKVGVGRNAQYATMWDEEVLSVPGHVAVPLLVGDEYPAGGRRATRAAGLLFLLRVLEFLGLPQWLQRAGADPGEEELPARIFARLLRRLQVPVGDPCWLLAQFDDAVPLPFVDVDRMVESGAATEYMPAGGEPAQIWLMGCRRWLRGRAGISLADVVARAGFVTITPTHVDVWLGLEKVDLRIRRAGLDLDPGWVPWLGRVVCFHYDGNRS